MELLTWCELMRLLRAELKVLFDQMAAALPLLPEGSANRQITFANLRRIERELMRRDMAGGLMLR